mgnify:CR=1 FL=1
MAFGDRKKRILTADETALWAHVTNHIQPLAKRAPLKSSETEAVLPSAHPQDVAREQKIAAPHIAQKNEIVQRNKIELPPLAPLERRLRQRLSRGSHPIDAVIDLHGMRQTEAYEALRRFIYAAQRQEASVVLVVTGKGASSAQDHGWGDERGVLRRTVPHWLRMPELRPYVIGFEPAAQHHGGSGALYVRIRRGMRCETA